jgi:hypothetical protein
MNSKLPFALLMLLAPVGAWANEWVMGNVSVVEDYTALNASYGILVTLTNKSYLYPNPVARPARNGFVSLLARQE